VIDVKFVAFSTIELHSLNFTALLFVACFDVISKYRQRISKRGSGNRRVRHLRQDTALLGLGLRLHEASVAPRRFIFGLLQLVSGNYHIWQLILE
jgi:hypothetical protein